VLLGYCGFVMWSSSSSCHVGCYMVPSRTSTMSSLSPPGLPSLTLTSRHLLSLICRQVTILMSLPNSSVSLWQADSVASLLRSYILLRHRVLNYATIAQFSFFLFFFGWERVRTYADYWSILKFLQACPHPLCGSGGVPV